jgi:hypothetical protein
MGGLVVVKQYFPVRRQHGFAFAKNFNFAFIRIFRFVVGYQARRQRLFLRLNTLRLFALTPVLYSHSRHRVTRIGAYGGSIPPESVLLSD